MLPSSTFLFFRLDICRTSNYYTAFLRRNFLYLIISKMADCRFKYFLLFRLISSNSAELKLFLMWTMRSPAAWVRFGSCSRTALELFMSVCIHRKTHWSTYRHLVVISRLANPFSHWFLRHCVLRRDQTHRNQFLWINDNNRPIYPNQVTTQEQQYPLQNTLSSLYLLQSNEKKQNLTSK